MSSSTRSTLELSEWEKRLEIRLPSKGRDMIDLDSSSALDELELGAYAAPTDFARLAKQSTSASNDDQRKYQGA